MSSFIAHIPLHSVHFLGNEGKPGKFFAAFSVGYAQNYTPCATSYAIIEAGIVEWMADRTPIIILSSDWATEALRTLLFLSFASRR